ncbi:MAG: PP2C family protein-serine/threonine phosphatase [bacterium]
MIEPKAFYRNFDYLLDKISKEKTSGNFLSSILNEFVVSFGKELRLGNWRVYEERGNEFVMVSPPQDPHRPKTPKVSLHSKAVQDVLKNGSFIFDQNHGHNDLQMENQKHYAVPAAFLLRSPEQRWIVVFDLKNGWIREKVAFALNAFRTALNYRLFSETITNDFEQAAQIQKSLLPSEDPNFAGFQFASRSQPAELVGGDLLDYFEFDEEILGFCIGDASGHGLPAALLVRDVVTGLRMGLEKHMKMVHTLQKLNHVIYRSTFSSRFVSLFYGEVEKTGQLIYVNAGHPTPFLVQGNDVHDLKATGLILGALPEITLHRSYINMEPGAVLVLYSDGIFERENRWEEPYGIDRIQKVVNQNQSLTAREILDIIFEDVFEYGGKTNWTDDSTVLVVKRVGTA